MCQVLPWEVVEGTSTDGIVILELVISLNVTLAFVSRYGYCLTHQRNVTKKLSPRGMVK